MNKMLLVVAGVGAGVWFYVNHYGKVKPAISASNGAKTSLSNFLSSGFGYPWRAPQPPRVDNRNQPDYHANPGAVNVGPHDSNAMVTAAGSVNAVGTIIHSVSDIWGNLNLSDAFGTTAGTSSGATVITGDDITVASSPDEVMAGGDVMPDNIVTTDTGNATDFNYDNIAS